MKFNDIAQMTGYVSEVFAKPVHVPQQTHVDDYRNLATALFIGFVLIADAIKETNNNEE